ASSLSFSEAVCGIMTRTSAPARRPGAGAMPNSRCFVGKLRVVGVALPWPAQAAAFRLLHQFLGFGPKQQQLLVLRRTLLHPGAGLLGPRPPLLRLAEPPVGHG